MFFSNEKTKALRLLDELGLPTDRSTWWVKYPKRALEEILRMQESTNAQLNCHNEKLVWDEWLLTNFNTQYHIFIETPGFPFKAPRVLVKSPIIKPWRRIHMYDDGRLCLMHPNKYHSRTSILEMRNLAASWCFCHEVFKHTGKWPSDEHPH